MNGEIPSVPITTLAGVSSLVDLLPEMPLPTPLPQTLSNKSLLFHPRVAEEAQRLLTMNDDNLIPQLIHSLSMTSSKHIDLKDQYADVPSMDHTNTPRLLAGILMRKPDVFKGKHEQMMDWSQPQQQSQMNPMYGMNNIPQQPTTTSMSVNPLDQLHHHSNLLGTDPMQSMMQSSLDFISGLTEQPPSSLPPPAKIPGDRPLPPNMMSYNCDTDKNKDLMYNSSPQYPQMNMNHQTHLPSQVNQQQVVAPGSSKASPFSSSYPSAVPSGSSPNSHSPFGPLPTGLMSSNSPSSTVTSGSAFPSNSQYLCGSSTSGSSVVLNNPDSSQLLHQQQYHQQQQVQQLQQQHQPHQLPLQPPQHQLPPASTSVATIAMNVPLLKLEKKPQLPPPPVIEDLPRIDLQQPASNNNAIPPPAQKELVIKLERNAEIQQALQKLKSPSTSSTATTVNTTTPPTPGRRRDSRQQPSRGDDGDYEDPPSGGNEEGSSSDSDSSPSKGKHGKIFKTKENKPSRRKKRQRSDSDFGMGGDHLEAKKRKSSTGGDVVNNAAHQEEELPKKKLKRVERCLIPVLEKLENFNVKMGGTSHNTLNNSTYHRFLKTMDIVLESIDYAETKGEIEDEDGNVPSELNISKSRLSELCSEAAKLKALGAMEAMPTDKIVRLLSLLEINLRDGCKVTPLADPEDNDDESRLWMELTMESISRGVMSALAALHILTSSNMPKRTYLEDLIDRIVIFTKFQLQNTIYPTFDPVYRIDKRGGKDGLGSSNKKKRAHAREVREKAMISLYTKIHEVVSLLAELLNVQVLTDTTVLHLSTLGVSPFFVENVSELQLSALKLVTGIFTHYEKHRRLLLDDILASIARLPSSKRSLRTFKLSAGSDECIQMLTALVLQLIQCVTHLPNRLAGVNPKIKAVEDGTEEQSSKKESNTERDILISGRFDTALKTAGTFLAVFLSKCNIKSEDCDYRTLFENFVQDLLSTVNKPEWPAAELLLTLLGNLLVKNLGNKGLEVSMRVASLEYLGVAAARLRKDAVSAQKKMETIDRIIADIRGEEERMGDVKQEPLDLNCEEDKVEFLQRLLLDYLAVHGQSDPALMQARHFYISSWWKSAQTDISKSIDTSSSNTKADKRKKKKKKKSSSSDEESEVSDLSDDEEKDEGRGGADGESSNNTNLLQLVERRRNFLLTKIRPFADPLLTSRKTEAVQTFVDYQSAELLTRYLASKRPFSVSFDFFLKRILSVSTEQTVAIRTKALRCLTMVVEADPSVLARQDMQLWVRHSFLDQSTAVREAAVDLVGKYVLSCPDLIEKYYDILSLRILDTGVSVRKRVIKILRDVCVEHPTFTKIPEICVKMIRRVNDEDGIRKLVMEVFQNMWFTAVKEDPLDTKSLLRKVSNITEVVASCEKIGLDFFEQLLLSLFKPKDDKEDVREKVVNPEPPKAVVTASRQIVNCLVEHVLRLEEGAGTGAIQPATTGNGQQLQTQQSSSSQRFVACVATLYLFAKIRPQLLVNHAITLEGYLSMRCQSIAEVQAIANIAAILELVVPLLVNPADSFLAQLEEDCVKLIFKNDKAVIESCLACLGAVVNKITRNYALVRDVFRRFQTVLFSQATIIRENPKDPRLAEGRPRLRRAIYTIGLFLRYFDFLHRDVYGDLPSNTVNIIFSQLMYLVEYPCVDLNFFSLQAIGNMCIRHYDFMLGDDLKRIYQSLLTSSAEIKLKTQALYNIQLYLTEEELRMIKQDQEWQKNKKLEDIKEMGDVTSGMASTIVQIYLKQILEAFLHRDISVRLAAVRVIQLVLQQGLVHPIQIVPYLICMSTDEEPGVATTADKQLQEMEKKHPQFLQSQVLNGIKLSLQLQRILAGYKGPVTHLAGFVGLNAHDQSLSFPEEDIPIVRGYRVRPKESPSALNGFLYSLLRSTKPQRRAIVLSLLKQFDDQNKTRLADLLYYCDNLAYFPYQVIDEPLFIIHHIDIVISVTGSNLLQSFKESLIPVPNHQNHSNLPVQPQQQLNDINAHMITDPHNAFNPGFPLENGNAADPLLIAQQQMQPPPPPVNSSMDDDDDDDDLESLVQRIPEDTKTLEDCIIGSQGCLLLLMLKQHLKDTYGITDTRITGYSPSDASKTFERPVNRRNAHVFDPKCTLANLSCPPSGSTPEGRQALVEQYIHFKQLMLRIDPEEGDEDGEAKPVKLKIDQNLFTYAANKGNPKGGQQPNNTAAHNQNASNAHQHHGVPDNHSVGQHRRHSGGPNHYHENSSEQSAQQYHVVIPKQQVVEPVRIPKLTIVPLKFPGNDPNPHRKSHKVKEHHHHHKHKKSKHKKKKRHAISDDSDSDNSDDPDFRL